MTLRKSCDFSARFFFLTQIQNDRCLLRLQREISVFSSGDEVLKREKFDTLREVRRLFRNMPKDRADVISPQKIKSIPLMLFAYSY